MLSACSAAATASRNSPLGQTHGEPDAGQHRGQAEHVAAVVEQVAVRQLLDVRPEELHGLGVLASEWWAWARRRFVTTRMPKPHPKVTDIAPRSCGAVRRTCSWSPIHQRTPALSRPLKPPPYPSSVGSALRSRYATARSHTSPRNAWRVSQLVRSLARAG